MFTLVRWNNLVINASGPLGHRVLRRYIVESGRLLKRRQRVAREWASYSKVVARPRLDVVERFKRTEPASSPVSFRQRRHRVIRQLGRLRG